MKRIYTLENNRLCAQVVPYRGANLISFKDKDMNVDALRTPKELDEFNTQNPYLYGMPVLFPPNRISGGRFEFEGREYVFPINEPATGCFLHGTLHETEFDVVCVDERSITCSYKADAESMYFGFPHTFEMLVSYALDEDKLVQTVEIKNNSELNMPVALAFHSTFNVPFVCGGNAQDVRLKIQVDAEYLRDEKYLPTEEVLTDSKYISQISSADFVPVENTISAFFKDAGKKCAALTDCGKGITLHYDVSDNYNYWMIYNGGAKDFICVEPQTWMTNCPNLSFPRMESGFQVVAPNESAVYRAELYCTQD